MERARKVVDAFPRFLDEFEKLIVSNEILIARTQDVGRLSAELAINAGITGPMLRACGVNYDLRKVDGYGFYPRFKFRVPLGDHGDCYDRFMMRVLEMRESIEILKQALRTDSGRPDHESEGEDPRFQTAGRRSLRPHRRAEGRTRLLFDQRRQRESVSLSRAPAEFHQPHHSGRYVSRPHRGGCDGHSRQHRYRMGEVDR